MQAIKHAVMDGVMSIDRDCRVGQEGKPSQPWPARWHHGLPLEAYPQLTCCRKDLHSLEWLIKAS